MSAIWIRLRRHWFRNLLAVLQVALAIAAVSAALVDVLPMLMQGDDPGATTYAVRFGTEGGGAAVWIWAYQPDDVTYLLEHATAVEAASAVRSEYQSLVMVNGERWVVRAQAAVHPAFARLTDLELVSGSFFADEDTRGPAPRVAVISEELARLLFGETDVVGKTINLRPQEEAMILMGLPSGAALAELMARPGDDVEIIGVFRTSMDSLLAVALGQAADLLVPFAADPGRPGGVTVSEILYRPRPDMEREAEEEVRRLLTSRLAERGESQQLIEGRQAEVLVSPVMSAGQLRQVRAGSSLLLGGLGLAALLVSSIAMFTTTLANLAPRTRYIGLSRALGATRGRIVREVVAESAVLAGIGGVVGAALAFPLRKTVFAPLFSSLGAAGGPGAGDMLLAGLAGVALAMAVGAVAALYPAWTVARMAPADAWREGTV